MRWRILALLGCLNSFQSASPMGSDTLVSTSNKNAIEQSSFLQQRPCHEFRPLDCLGPSTTFDLTWHLLPFRSLEI
jgi:hypothetical protein